MRRAAVALLLLPLALAACGGGGSKSGSGSASTPLDAVKAATTKTLAAGSETIKLTIQGSTGGQSLSMTGTGAIDTKTLGGTMHLSLDAGPIATTFDEVFTPKFVYVKSPLLSGQLPAGKSWIKVDATAAAKASGVPSTLMSQNPADELKKLQDLKSATKVGTDSLGTHYTATLDTSKLPASVKKTGVGGYDVWVGADGYIRRIKVGASGVSVTVDFTDVGKPVTVTPPPASQVYETSNGSLPGLGG